MTSARTRELRRSTPWQPERLRERRFRPLDEVAARFSLLSTFPTVEEIDRLLSPSAHVRFIAQQVPNRRGRNRHRAEPYDEKIVHGAVPTRPQSWHDLMNALVWARFPRAKQALHSLQRQLLLAASTETPEHMRGRRSRRHDALAMLDEGGVVVLCANPTSDEHAVEREIREGRAAGLVFGHAYFEALAIEGPMPLLRAWVLTVESLPSEAELVERVDALVAQLLSEGKSPASPAEMVRISTHAIECLQTRCNPG